MFYNNGIDPISPSTVCNHLQADKENKNKIFDSFNSLQRSMGEALRDYPKIIPATVAEIKDAIEPPNRAFIPNLEMVLRCPGAKEPIPPI
jgi:hypothetical protein